MKAPRTVYNLGFRDHCFPNMFINCGFTSSSSSLFEIHTFPVIRGYKNLQYLLTFFPPPLISFTVFHAALWRLERWSICSWLNWAALELKPILEMKLPMIKSFICCQLPYDSIWICVSFGIGSRLLLTNHCHWDLCMIERCPTDQSYIPSIHLLMILRLPSRADNATLA